MKTIKILTRNKAEFVSKSTRHIEQLIQELLIDKPIINIALSGGSTPMPIYEKLRDCEIEWSRINFFLVDERCVPNTSDQSNYNNISEVLFKHISSKSYPMVCDANNYGKSANLYEDTIIKHVELLNNKPQFDLIILGMGLDGHTASLFPNTKALNNDQDLVVLNNVPQLDTDRITMTYPLIINSNKIVLLIQGNEKQQVLKESVSKNFPISRIIPYIDYIIN
ncbi:MAG: 6-phosphogluconolactonase [Psychroserpens sp.]|uniref:6-phosphogluconolactonase n=1 Tax=Psychroserpens sp. TaxID=2020870 RepID=UPI003001BF4F